MLSKATPAPARRQLQEAGAMAALSPPPPPPLTMVQQAGDGMVKALRVAREKKPAGRPAYKRDMQLSQAEERQQHSSHAQPPSLGLVSCVWATGSTGGSVRSGCAGAGAALDHS